MRLFPDPKDHCWHRQASEHRWGPTDEEVERHVCCFCGQIAYTREEIPIGHGKHIPPSAARMADPPDVACPARRSKIKTKGRKK